MVCTTNIARLIFIFFFLAANQPSFAGITDTSKYSLVKDRAKSTAGDQGMGEANIIYPEIFKGQEKHFLSYVEKFSVNRRAYLMRTFARGKSFFPKANTILKKYNVPTEFVVLLALESAFNGNAVSSAGAVGYWQIMDDVAKEYGLKIQEGQHKLSPKHKGQLSAGIKGKSLAKKAIVTDERKNFTKSTHTAARYLKDRMRNLNNDRLLVAASYNWGVGNVWKAMQRTGKTSPTFWDIQSMVPAETRAYVMNFISLNVIFKNYAHFSKGNLCFKEAEAQQDDKGVSTECASIEEPGLKTGRELKYQ